MSVAEMLRSLRQQRVTGMLELLNPRLGNQQLYYMDGDVIAATVDEEELHFARTLVRSGRIAPLALYQALQHRTPGTAFWEQLVTQKLLSEQDKETLLSARFRELVLSAFLGIEKSLKFSELDAVFVDNLQLFFDTDELLAEGLRLSREVSVLFAQLAREDHVYLPLTPVASLTASEHVQLCALMNGVRTSTELFVVSPFEPLQTLRVLTQLLEQGHIRNLRARPLQRLAALPHYPFLAEELRDGGREIVLVGMPSPTAQPVGTDVAPLAPPPVPSPVFDDGLLDALIQDRLSPVSPQEPELPTEASLEPPEQVIEPDTLAELELRLTQEAPPIAEVIEDRTTAITDQIKAAVLSDALEQLAAESPTAASEEVAPPAPPAPPAEEHEVQELWSDTPVFQPRDHSNPSAGVFLSGDSVLDTVDLSHIAQFGIATDIPLDGIVETCGAEDEEGERHESVSSTSLSSGVAGESSVIMAAEASVNTLAESSFISVGEDSLIPAGEASTSLTGTTPPDAAKSTRPDGGEEARRLAGPNDMDDGWDAASVLAEGDDVSDGDEVEPLPLNDIVSEGIPPVYEDDFDDDVDSLHEEVESLHNAVTQDDDANDITDLSETSALEETGPLGDEGELDELSGEDDGLTQDDGTESAAEKQVSLLAATPRADVAEELLADAVSPVNGPLSWDAETSLLEEPLLPIPGRLEPRLEPPPRRDEFEDDDDDVALFPATGIVPLDAQELHEEVQDLLDFDSSAAILSDQKPLAGTKHRPESPPVVDEISPEERELLAHIQGLFRPRTAQTSPGPGRKSKRPLRNQELRRTGVTVNLSTAQKGLLRQRTETWNHIYTVIFTHVARKVNRERTRSMFQDFFAPGNGSYPEMFQNLSFKADGMIDAEQLIRNLEAYPTHRPIQLLESCLNEIFHFLIRQVDEVLDPAEQVQMMEGVTPLFNQLSKRSDLPS